MSVITTPDKPLPGIISTVENHTESDDEHHCNDND